MPDPETNPVRRAWPAVAAGAIGFSILLALLPTHDRRLPSDEPKEPSSHAQGHATPSVQDHEVSAPVTPARSGDARGETDFTLQESDAYRVLSGTSRFEDRVNHIETELLGALDSMKPADQMRFLDGILAMDPGEASLGVMSDIRIRRVLAIRYYARVASLDPGLAPEAFTRVKAVAAGDPDYGATSQAIALLAGIPTETIAFSTPDGMVEGFVTDRQTSSAPAWIGSLRPLAAGDPESTAILFSYVHGDGRFRRTAIEALAALESAEVDAELWRVGDSNPLIQEHALPRLLDRADQEQLSKALNWLATADSPEQVHTIAAALENSNKTLPPSTAELAAAWQTVAEGDDYSIGVARRTVARLIARTWLDSGDPAAREWLLATAGSNDPEAAWSAAGAIARSGDASFIEPLEHSLQQTADPYIAEAARYAIKSLDPSREIRSLQYEIEQIRSRLKTGPKLPPPEEQLLREQLGRLRAEYHAIRGE